MPHLKIEFLDTLNKPHFDLTPVNLPIGDATAKAFTQDEALFDAGDAIPNDGILEEKIGIPVPIIGKIGIFVRVSVSPDPVPVPPAGQGEVPAGPVASIVPPAQHQGIPNPA